MKIRIVEDNAEIARWLELALEDREDVRFVTTTRDFDDVLTRESWEGINTALIDLNLSRDVTGLDILRYLAGEFPDIWRVVLTAQATVDERVRDMANEVVYKPAGTDEIYEALSRGRRGRLN